MSIETRTSIVWDYAPAPESADHVRLRERYGVFIAGEFRDPAEGRFISTINPATEKPWAHVAAAGREDLVVEHRVASTRGQPAGVEVFRAQGRQHADQHQ